MLVDLFLVYQFIKRLATPFNEWEAYKLGIIDERGDILKKRRNLALKKERDAFGVYDLMILNIKKLIEKLPGGQTRIASYAAALFLIKECKMFTNESILNENTEESLINTKLHELNIFLKGQPYYTRFSESVNPKNAIEEEIPTVNVGSGNIAGLGVGPQGEPGFRPNVVARHRRRNRNLAKVRSIIASKM
jgi:hypothetical protein